jgi:hypothetical protein
MRVAAQHDQQAAELDDDDPPPPSADGDLPRNTPPTKPDGTPQPKAQRNFTDPESRIMVRDGAFLQAASLGLVTRPSEPQLGSSTSATLRCSQKIATAPVEDLTT